ncbi:MAG: PIG-L family deacetylase, partial [Acidobacteriota bacterium]
MKQAAAFVLALSLAAPLTAQTATFPDPANLAGTRPSPVTGYELPVDQGTLGLQQLLRKLQTRASILNIVAHPDDEDGGMLTLNARGLGARVADLSLTRGEGGQNAMTGDFEDALGLLRTQELLANDRYTGVTQMFGTEVDFGFSKTKSEAFAKWTHDRVLYDAVRAIRIFRPLVITATFIGEPTDGHGQHQVSGQIAQEAFVAAGEPNVFPELTREGILPWQPLKMYARAPFGAVTPQGLFDYATNQYVPAKFTNYITHESSSTAPTADIVIHEGTPDPLLTIAAANPKDLPPSLAKQSPDTQLTYVQFARLGLGLQKSQIGPGVREARSGSYDVSYHLYGSRLCNAKPDTRVPDRSTNPTAAAKNPLILSGAKDL